MDARESLLNGSPKSHRVFKWKNATESYSIELSALHRRAKRSISSSCVAKKC
jgi:hypothetical protein